jgi:NAD-dependent SIR2 family protein deacetylase
MIGCKKKTYTQDVVDKLLMDIQHNKRRIENSKIECHNCHDIMQGSEDMFPTCSTNGRGLVPYCYKCQELMSPDRIVYDIWKYK